MLTQRLVGRALFRPCTASALAGLPGGAAVPVCASYISAVETWVVNSHTILWDNNAAGSIRDGGM